MLTTIIVVGILVIGAIGITGRRRTGGMSEWMVGGRDFSRWTTWFLQAGESLTTFSFLGLAGIAFAGGVSAVYAVGYLTAAAVGLYFVGPRVRDLGAAHGYLTMADFFRDRFRSRPLSVIVAIVGALFLIPYLQLQITGLGLIVELATGSETARGLSMVLASALVVVFVLWAGIRGVARVAVFKDFGMLIALAIVGIGVIAAAGGFPEIFARVGRADPTLFTTHAPGFDATFFINAVVITSIGSCFNTFPHLWAPTFAATSGAVLRSNAKWLATYQLLLFIPITAGMGAIVLIPRGTTGNRVLFTVSQSVLPEWLVAVVAVFGAAAAMVPAAAIVMGISSLLSHNVLFRYPEKLRFRLNHFFVILAVALALVFGLAGNDIGALLLLTYGGLSQMAPAVASGLARTVRLSAPAAMGGIIAGTATVILLTFGTVPIGHWDSGLIALVPNLLVLAIVETVVRTRRRRRIGVVVAG